MKQNFYIHTFNDEQMHHVLKKLVDNDIIDNETMEKCRYIYDVNNKKDLKLNYEWLQGYNHNEANFKSPKVLIKINKEDVDKIFEILNVKRYKNNFCWYPSQPDKKYKYVKGNTTNKYPIFVISKGRYNVELNKKLIYQAPLTIKYLEKCNIDYKIIVEKQEYQEYCKSINKENIIILPDEYMNKNQGSIPVRNFVHHYNLKNKNHAYWILDDNIRNYIYNDNDERFKITDGLAFRLNENILDNHQNLYLTGHQYKMFIMPKQSITPIISNHTRVYSSILIKTDIPVINENNDIWRGKYNEDTDLSLRILKLGLPTLITNNIVADKEKTGGKGGNELIYKEDNNASGELKSKSLLEHHSDVVDIVKRYGRTHHKIKNEFINKCREEYPLIKNDEMNIIKFNIEFYNE